MGNFARNRDNDFAGFANLGGKHNLSKTELSWLANICDPHREFPDLVAECLALIESERLYRVSCLLAYGSNPTKITKKGRRQTHKSLLAAESDIVQFAHIEEHRETSLDEVGEPVERSACVYEVTLPYDVNLPGILSQTLRTPSKYHTILNPLVYHFGEVRQVVIDDGRSQKFTMWSYDQEKDPTYKHEPFKVLAQVIINARIQSNLIGIYDGHPLFEAACPIDKLWQTLAELADGQAPGICPVCGKLIDRRRGESGGHPPVACKNHINKFHNELKKEVRNSPNHDPSQMAYSDNCELAVRGLRWFERPDLNERPLRFDTALND